MNKNIIIFCAIVSILSLAAFGFINWTDSVEDKVEISSSNIAVIDKQVVEAISGPNFPDFFYGIGTRFNAIKKEDLDKLKSFNDIIEAEHAQRIMWYNSVSIIILEDDKETDIIETGKSDIFTDPQIELLRSLDYSTSILIRADYTEKSLESGKLEDSYWTPHLTIVPEKQAEYLDGNDALIEYLRENSLEFTSMALKSKLQPAKLYFTITKEGTISKVKLERSSGYPTIDEKMIELISKVSGKWVPAENHKGEKVNQELVFSFGLMGC